MGHRSAQKRPRSSRSASLSFGLRPAEGAGAGAAPSSGPRAEPEEGPSPSSRPAAPSGGLTERLTSRPVENKGEGAAPGCLAPLAPPHCGSLEPARHAGVTAGAAPSPASRELRLVEAGPPSDPGCLTPRPFPRVGRRTTGVTAAPSGSARGLRLVEAGPPSGCLAPRTFLRVVEPRPAGVTTDAAPSPSGSALEPGPTEEAFLGFLPPPPPPPRECACGAGIPKARLPS